MNPQLHELPKNLLIIRGTNFNFLIATYHNVLLYPLSYYRHNRTTTVIFTHALLSNTSPIVVSKLLDPGAPWAPLITKT